MTTYRITNPHSCAFSFVQNGVYTFGQVTVPPGQSLLAGIPGDMLKSMLDAGLRVEEVGDESAPVPETDDDTDTDTDPQP